MYIEISLQEKFTWKGLLHLPGAAFSVAYSSVTTGQIHIWHMYAVVLGKLSKYDVITFRPIGEVVQFVLQMSENHLKHHNCFNDEFEKSLLSQKWCEIERF